MEGYKEDEEEKLKGERWKVIKRTRRKKKKNDKKKMKMITHLVKSKENCRKNVDLNKKHH